MQRVSYCSMSLLLALLRSKERSAKGELLLDAFTLGSWLLLLALGSWLFAPSSSRLALSSSRFKVFRSACNPLHGR
jgi:hypothetical protein